MRAMGNGLVHGALVGLLVMGTACGSRIHKVAYTPQPERIEDPAKMLATLILANTTPGCVTNPTYSDALFIVKFVCNRGTGNIVLRPSLVESIEVQESAPWFRILVHHRNQIDDFTWSSKNLDDVQHMADSVHALAFPAAPQPVQPPITTM